MVRLKVDIMIAQPNEVVMIIDANKNNANSNQQEVKLYNVTKKIMVKFFK